MLWNGEHVSGLQSCKHYILETELEPHLINMLHFWLISLVERMKINT